MTSFARYCLILGLICSCRTTQTKKEGPIPSAPVADPAAADSADDDFPEEAFRASQPAAAAPRPFQIPVLKQFRLPQGIDVYLVERHTLPTISFRLVFPGGSRQVSRRRQGTSAVCMSLLAEGTKRLDRTAFREALADIASSISSYATSDQLVVSMSTITEHFDKTFLLYAEMLAQPGVREDDFKRLVALRLETLKQVKGSARSVARRLNDMVLYGRKHPLGRIVTERSLKKIRLKDCKRYFKKHIRPSGARLFVVGDTTEAQIRKAFGHEILAPWKGSVSRLRQLPRPKPLRGRIFFVDIPNAAQSSLRLVDLGPARKAKDYFANSLMSALLAGSFSGRMNMNLREDKGYSYGARGGFYYNQDYGKFVAGTSVRSDATWQSLIELHREFVDIHAAKRPARKEELARERQGAILSLPARFATARKTLGQYSELVYHGLPLNYYDSIVQSYQAVTLEQVNRSASEHLDPSQLKILVVGDGSKKMIQRVDGKDVPLNNASGNQMTLKEALAFTIKKGTLGSGKLVTLDVDGNPK